MIIDELITILGFDVKDKGKLDSYRNSIGSVVSEIKTMAVVGAAAMGAVLAGITAVNSETAKMANLAETVGLKYELVEGLGSAIKAIGLDYEHVTDLAEELSNKVGESKSIYADWLKGDKLEGKELKLVGGLEDAFKGLDFSIVDEKFKGLKLEEKFKMFSSMDITKQFELVMDTASTMKDAQQAASMVDILMGGEANKILSYLRTQGTTMSELLAKKREMNFLDREGIWGAKEYAKQTADTSSIFGSISKQLSGLAGEYLSPILKIMNDWFRINKQIIQIKLKEYVENIFYVFGHLKNILETIWSGVNFIAMALGGWDVVLPILGVILAFFNPFYSAVMAVILVFDDLISYFKGGKSVIGDFVDYFKSNFPMLSGIIESIGGVFLSVFGFFKSVYENMIAPFFNKIKSDTGSFSEIFNLVIDAISSAFSNFGSWIVAKASAVFGAIAEYMKQNFPVLYGLFSAIGNLFGSVFGLVKSIAGAIGGAFSTLFGIASGVFNAIWRVISSVFSAIWAVVSPIVNSIISLLGSVFSTLLSVISSVFSTVLTIIGNVLIFLINGFANAIDLIKIIFDGLVNIFGTVFGFIKQKAQQFWTFLKNGFEVVGSFISAGAETIKKAWTASLDWIMKKVKWVTDKIDAVSKGAAEIGGDISDGIASAWDGAVNLFGGNDDKKTSSEKITNIKETISSIKEKVVQSPMITNIAPIQAPAPLMSKVSNQANNTMNHTHNNSYTINVSSQGGNAIQTAEIIKSRIIDTKAIEKANVNKVKSPFEAK